jgi:hypothetical protein
MLILALILYPFMRVPYASMRKIMDKGSKNHGRSSATLYAGGAQPGTLDEEPGRALAGTAERVV